MARIKTYEIDNVITDNDIVIGSDFETNDKTKNYTVGGLRQYINAGLEPITGGTLKITTITDSQNIQPHTYLNALDPALDVLQYEIVFFILGGKTWIFRRNNGLFGLGEEQSVLSDFTEVDVTSSVATPGLDPVLEAGDSSLRDANIGKLGLYNPVNELYDIVEIIDGRFFRFKNTLLNQWVQFDSGNISFFNGAQEHNLIFPGGNFNASLQSKSGTIAYLDDIPSVPVTNVTAGQNAFVDQPTAGNFRVACVLPEPPLFPTTSELYSTFNQVVVLQDGGDITQIQTDESFDDLEVILTFNDKVELNSDAGNFADLIYFDILTDVGVERHTWSSSRVTLQDEKMIVPFIPQTFNTGNILQIKMSISPNLLVNFTGNIPSYMTTWNVLQP